jgi:hypothetical protein
MIWSIIGARIPMVFKVRISQIDVGVEIRRSACRAKVVQMAGDCQDNGRAISPAAANQHPGKEDDVPWSAWAKTRVGHPLEC